MPTGSELDRIVRSYEAQLERFRMDPEAARQVAGDGSGDPAERAAWTMVANALLNLDETLAK